MQRRAASLLPTLWLCMAASCMPALGADKPNIIFILTDDHRADILGAAGHPVVRTPHLDRLAAEGTLFSKASITSAICTPSRACFFLGQYERRHGINFNSGTAMAEAAWQKSYPMLLREAGYFTGYIGKNHVPVGAKGYASGIIENSFDFWYGGHGHLTFYPKTQHAIFKNAAADTQVEVLAGGAMNFIEPNASFAAGAQDFLKKRPADRPFCLSICFNLPHSAGTGSMKMLPSDPELYRTAYREMIDELPLGPHYVAQAGIKTPRLPPDVLRAEHRQSSYDYVNAPAAMREQLVRVYQTVTGIDRMVGGLRAKLDEHGLAGNTVIIFTSDHGIMFGEFGLGGKALNYEPCLRVPMIIHDPRVKPSARGQKRDELVLGLDLAATILSLAGMPPPATMQGRDLMPLVRGDTVPWREAVFAENLWSTPFGNPRIESARTPDWKYIRYFANDRDLLTGEGPAAPYDVTAGQAALYAKWLTASIEGEQPVHEELFHLAVDPLEGRNLAQDPQHRIKLEEMRQRISVLVREARGDASAPATVPLEAGGKSKTGKGQGKGKGKGKGKGNPNP